MLELNSQSAIAIVRLIVTIGVSVGATFGWVLDADLLFNILVSVAALVVLVYTWWKNNNLTQAAQESQKVLNEIKKAKRDGDDIEIIVRDVEPNNS